jgi:hypothetical protein
MLIGQMLGDRCVQSCQGWRVLDGYGSEAEFCWVWHLMF